MNLTRDRAIEAMDAIEGPPLSTTYWYACTEGHRFGVDAATEGEDQYVVKCPVCGIDTVEIEEYDSALGSVREPGPNVRV